MPEPFWHIQMTYKQGATECAFTWARNRLFDYGVAAVLYSMCVEEGKATVTRSDGKEKKRYAPSPLSTLEMQKKGTGVSQHFTRPLNNHGLLLCTRAKIFEKFSFQLPWWRNSDLSREYSGNKQCTGFLLGSVHVLSIDLLMHPQKHLLFFLVH